jgi:hypothetical protein
LISSDGRRTPEMLEQVSVLQCCGCGEGFAVVEEQIVSGKPKPLGGNSGSVSWLGLHWWPPATFAALDNSIPANSREAYIEGAKCLSIRAPRAAAVMFRRTLEALVSDKGSTQAVQSLSSKNLASALQVMADEGSSTKASPSGPRRSGSQEMGEGAWILWRTLRSRRQSRSRNLCALCSSTSMRIPLGYREPGGQRQLNGPPELSLN